MSLPEGYSIRLFKADDAPSLAAITVSAIKRIGLRHYPKEQVDAWAARHPSPQRFLNRAEAGALILVATAGTIPVAYALLEEDDDGDGHLDMLYCHQQHTRLGLADALLRMAEEAARANGSARIYTKASELARPAFERVGYEMTHRRDFSIEHDGKDVPIHNYAMEKRLK